MSESVSSLYILPSKLSPPNVPTSAIVRTRVNQEFCIACEKSLVVLCAPAGFGKTTASLHGFSALKENTPQAKLAWVSLDSEDSDPSVFAAYLISAIKSQVPLSDALCNSGIHDRNTQLNSLVNQLLYELGRIPQRLLVVLDDFHVVDSDIINGAVAYLTRHLPPHVTLVLNTRSDPPASIMSLRLQGLVADIESDLLGFDVSEAQLFFDTMGHGYRLDEPEVKLLLEHVEGWAVGLQLIVLGLTSKPSLDELKSRLQQRSLDAIDYFDSEVFVTLPEDVKSFLLKTSIVERFNIEIAQALTNDLNVHEIIEYLQRQNLFIVQFNEAQQWFRYHHLLREFLLHKLQVTSSREVGLLHHHASQAFLKMGYVVSAVRHAVAARDEAQLVNVLQKYGDDLLHTAHYDLLEQCLAELSEQVITADSNITLICCWVAAIYGDALQVDYILKKAEAQLIDDSREGALLQAEFETVRSQAYFSLGNLDAAELAAQRALTGFPASDTRRHASLLTYANVKFELGELDAALSIYEESEALSRQEFNHDAVLWSLYQQSQIWRQRCDFERSIMRSKAVQEYAKRNNVNSGFNTCFSLIDQAELALEMFRLRESRQLIIEVGLLCQNWDEFWAQHLLGWLLKMEMLKGKPTIAKDLSSRHEPLLSQENFAKHLIPYAMEVQLLFWWQTGELDKINTWLKSTPPINRCQNMKDYVIFRAQLYGLMANKDYKRVLKKIDRVCLPLQKNKGLPFRLEFIRLKLLRVTVIALQGHKTDALSELYDLVPQIQRFNIVASVLFLGQWLMPLFEKLSIQDFSRDEQQYIHQLLTLSKQRRSATHSSAQGMPDGLLALGISNKEWRVLQSIIDGKSNDKIAAQMFIAVSTVKTHINSLYRKLSVSNRKQAIAKGTVLADQSTNTLFR